MADEDNTIQYLIEFDLGENGGMLRARNAEELEQWAFRERDFWRWVAAKELQATPQVHSIGQNVFRPLKALADKASQIKANQDVSQRVAEIRDMLKQYQSKRLLHSSTREAQFIAQLRDSVGQVEAVAALGQLLNHKIDLADFRQLYGAVALVVFREGITERTALAVQASLKTLSDDYAQRFKEDTAEIDRLRRLLSDLVDQQSELRDRGLTDMHKAIRLARTQAATQRAESQKRLETLEQLYNTKLSLDAPVTYWRHKRRKHRIWAALLSGLFVLYIAAVLYYGWKAIADSPLSDLTFWQSAGIEMGALVLIAVGVVAALARVLLRLAMSQLHLGNDADERVTMVNTYLALRQAEHANEQHMQIVLERLFAPASDGIVKTDLGPITVGEAAHGMFTSKT